MGYEILWRTAEQGDSGEGWYIKFEGDSEEYGAFETTDLAREVVAINQAETDRIEWLEANEPTIRHTSGLLEEDVFQPARLMTPWDLSVITVNGKDYAVGAPAKVDVIGFLRWHLVRYPGKVPPQVSYNARILELPKVLDLVDADALMVKVDNPANGFNFIPEIYVTPL